MIMKYANIIFMYYLNISLLYKVYYKSTLIAFNESITCLYRNAMIY